MPAPDRKAQRDVVALVVALTLACLAYRLLVLGRLEHSALLFTGIPAILGIVTVVVARPKSVTGIIVKVITIALCLAGILFGEGLVCLLFAAPLFYLIGILAGWAIDHHRKQRSAGGTALSLTVLLVVMGSGAEGSIGDFGFDRDEVVSITRRIEATPAQVATALAATPRFDRPLPPFLRLEFPTPGAISGAGLALGARRTVEFLHGGHHPGTLVLEVSESAPQRVRFIAVADDSYLVHWLSWRDATVDWRRRDDGTTDVTWTLRYRRRLDPAWYFAPLERFAVGLTAGYLIDAVATPR